MTKLKTMSVVALATALLTIGAGKANAATSCVNPGGTGGCYSSIQAAINAASSGDTITVAAGTYNESVTIDKTLTLLGAQAGVDARTRVPSSESIINNSCSPVEIFADNVILDGFTVQGSTQTDPCTIAGIYTNPGSHASDVGGYKIRNNIVQNNIIGIEMDNTGALAARVERNLIQNNNNNGPDGGTGIDTNFGASNVTVDSNKFVGNTNSAINLINAGGSNLTFSNNEFASNRRAIGLQSVTSSVISNNNIHNSNDNATADLRIFGAVSDLKVTCNTFANGAGRAIRMDDQGLGPNSMIKINFNNISGYPVAGLEVNSGGYSGGPMSLDATNDWWGSASGPLIASNPGGTGEPIVDPDGVVKYNPFIASPSSCAVCPNSNPGCTTNRKDCQTFVEQEEKNFDDQQKAQKKSFDDGQKMQKQQFDATHPTSAQRKAFDDQQKADKKNFDNMQKTNKDSFQAHYNAEEQQCSQLPK